MRLCDHKGDYQYDFLIAGAGLYGAVMARELSDRGFRVIVAEKKDHPGGSVYTETSDGIVIHKYGPHILHTSDEVVWSYLKRFADIRPFVNRPAANYSGRLYDLPINMNTFEQIFGVTDPDEVKEIIRVQRTAAGLEGVTPSNLEEQAIATAGTEIYEKLIKAYSEKQWGRPCKKLPASILKRLELRFSFDSNYYSDIYQGIPAGGYTAMINNLLSGIEVIYGADLSRPDTREKLAGMTGKVIYSGSIDSYYGYCLGRLGYRSISFEEERIEGIKTFQDRAVINYTGNEVPYTRVTEHKHFESDRETMNREFTVISREFPEEYDGSNDPLYPLPDERNKRLYGEYRQMAASDAKVFFGGRLGSYKYMDMDETVAAALADSERLAAGR